MEFNRDYPQYFQLITAFNTVREYKAKATDYEYLYSLVKYDEKLGKSVRVLIDKNTKDIKKAEEKYNKLLGEYNKFYSL